MALHRRRRIERALWTTVVVVSMVGMFLWARSRDVSSLDPAKAGTAIRYKLLPADGTAFYSSSDLPFALSPAGRHIVYVSARADGTRQLWLRSLYSEVEQQMSGTEAANKIRRPSQWIGFFAGSILKKVRILGSADCRQGS